MSADPALDLCVPSRVVRRVAAERPERLALVFESAGRPYEEVTFGQLHMRSNAVAAALSRLGAQQGDRVAVMMRNEPWFVYSLIANCRLGVETVPIDPRARGDRLHHFLGLAEVRLLICSDDIARDAAVVEVAQELGVIVLATDVTGETRPDTLEVIDRADLDSHTVDPGEAIDDLTRTWLVAFTSGTTGLPKAILFKYLRLSVYQHLASRFGYTTEDIPYSGLSLTHGNALLVTLMPALWCQVDHSVISAWFTASRLWQICAERGATTWSNLGGLATAIFSQPPSDLDHDNNVRLVVSAGMPSDLWLDFEERFNLRVLEWYGTMEGGFAYKPVDVGPIGSFGKAPSDLFRVDVVDEFDHSVKPGIPGELIFRPISGDARLEYYKDPQASAAKVRGGWLRTGDIVTRDSDGWLFFRNRSNDGEVRRFGEFISLTFVQSAIAKCDGIRDVYVYGIDNVKRAPGERDIVAAVVLAEGVESSDVALQKQFAGLLERSHRPDRIQIVAELPTTPSAKVQEHVLREMLG